jgi:NCS1 family nucleobase:cation symporter-1
VDSSTLPSGAGSTFTVVAGDRRAEVAPTLAGGVPQSLGVWDQVGLWGNLGVSLLGFIGAVAVLQPGGPGTPRLSMAAALVAIVVGTVLGSLAVAFAGLPGARTGAPAMVLLRGLFGVRLSYLPTVLNVVQCLGWGTFELVTIAAAAHYIAPGGPQWAYVCAAGALTTALTVRPLGSIRVLRRYVTGAVVVVLAYLFARMLAQPLPPMDAGTWSGFWPATDTTVAVAVSWVPLAADYTRHSRTGGAAFVGTFAGYSATQTICYVIGLLVALETVVRTPQDVYHTFMAVPLGAAALAILVARELDQSFANVYSTAVSVQNLKPLWDRRVLAAVIGAATTAIALVANLTDYENFLYLIGSVFVPLFAVLVVDFFVVSRGRWQLATGGTRWAMVGPWILGFAVYQAINPGSLPWWAAAWHHLDAAAGFRAAPWMSASILSFLVAAAATALAGGMARLLSVRTAPSDE